MSLRQIQIAVDYPQDRLLVRFSTGKTDELRAFITRRALRELWPMLMSKLSVVKKEEEVGQESSSEAAEKNKEQESKKQKSFEKEFENPNASFPLGQKPLLVGEWSISVLDNGNFQISLREPKERRFDIALDYDGMHMFCSMLKAASTTAQWDLGLEFGISESATTPVPASSEKSDKADAAIPVVSKLLH